MMRRSHARGRSAAPRILVLACLGALTMASCGKSPTAPDDASTTSTTPRSIDFEGTLEVNGSSFYSFTVTQAGSVTGRLASLSLVGQRTALEVPLRIGIGVPRGEGCAVVDSVDTSPSLVTQLTATREAGIYCVSVADAGRLPGPAIFVIRFSYL
jgi:hypothetical protein